MAFDLTADAGQVAVVATGTKPASGDWRAATWVRAAPTAAAAASDALSTEYRYVKVTATVTGGTDTAWARILIGPASGDINPGPGTYDVWVKVTDSPEVPVLKAGTLTLT